MNVESIWSGNKEVDALFGGLIGAMGMYELNPNGVLEIIRVNDGYYDLFGSSPGSVYSDLGLSFSRLEDESKDLLLNACSRAKYENQIINVELKKYHEDGSFKVAVMQGKTYWKKRQQRLVLYIDK